MGLFDDFKKEPHLTVETHDDSFNFDYKIIENNIKRLNSKLSSTTRSSLGAERTQDASFSEKEGELLISLVNFNRELADVCLSLLEVRKKHRDIVKYFEEEGMLPSEKVSNEEVVLEEISLIKSSQYYQKLLDLITNPKIETLIELSSTLDIKSQSFPYVVALTDKLIEKYGNESRFKYALKLSAIKLYKKLVNSINSEETNIELRFHSVKNARVQSTLEKKLEKIILNTKYADRYYTEAFCLTNIGKRSYDFLISDVGVIEINGLHHNFPSYEYPTHIFTKYAGEWINQAAVWKSKIDFLRKNNCPCLVLDSKDIDPHNEYNYFDSKQDETSIPFDENNVTAAVRDFFRNTKRYLEENYYNRSNSEEIKVIYNMHDDIKASMSGKLTLTDMLAVQRINRDYLTDEEWEKFKERFVAEKLSHNGL